MSSVSGLVAPHRIIARDRATNAAILARHHAPEIHYTMDRPQEIRAQGRAMRWDGIRYRKQALRGQFATHYDCSSFVSWCLWNGLYLPFHCRDTVNGSNWTGGFTGTMLRNGKLVRHLENVQRADYVIYGNGGNGEHTALVMGRHPETGKLMVMSHGSEAGPLYLEYDYRDDIMEIRRAI